MTAHICEEVLCREALAMGPILKTVTGFTLAHSITLGPPAWLHPVPTCAIGSVASYWLIARVAAIW